MDLLNSFTGAMDDPSTMGLLGAAGNMLQASGPSLMPHSLGQVLNAGLQGGMAGYKSTQDRMRENVAFQLQNAQLAQALRQGQITQAVYEKLLARLNGGQGAPAAGAASPELSGTPQASYPGMPAAPSSGAAPSDGGSRRGGSFGLSDDAMLGGMLAGPAELGKAIIAANAPTDLKKMMREAGIDPDSALGRQLMQQQIAKQNNIPLQAGRAGAPMYDSSGRVVAMAPKIPDNAIPQIVNGQVVGVSALPGGAGVEQVNSYAGAAGKAQAKPIAGVDANGQPVFTNELAASGGAGVPSGPDLNNMTPEQRAALMAQARAQFGLQPGATPGSSVVRPAAAPGFAESQGKLAGAAADRYNGLITQAGDSPTRVNVYDNILGLSKEGVQTGPTAEWSNKLKGYVASTPGLSSMFPGLKSDVSNYQEINKFMYQNAQRNWQAAGGTGTDSQLEAFSKSNPNPAMFPQALQKMAEWGKAGELALQARANATQQYKDANNGNVANLDKFERSWRNSFDPVLFQLKTMPADQAAAYVANLKQTNPNAYATLMMKATALKNMGGL